MPGVNAGIMNTLQQECYLAPFPVMQARNGRPEGRGGACETRPCWRRLYALAGMLVYIAFRFEWIYGLAAVIAVFHDTIITIGLFSLFNEEISMTVIAALLTLVGYSMNDTIVIFDRIRENLKIMRREPLESLMNKSVNQTLSRTIMTSGLTFLTVIALFIWGGPVLHGFSFALVCGIIVGTYSSVFIASPIVLFWHNYADKRKARTAPVSAAAARSRRGAQESVEGGQVSSTRSRRSRTAPRSRKERELVCLSKHSSRAGRPRRPGRCWSHSSCQIVLDRRRDYHPDDLLRRPSQDAVDQFPGGASAAAASSSASRRAAPVKIVKVIPRQFDAGRLMAPEGDPEGNRHD